MKPDEGQRLTDDLLKEYEAKIAKEYRKAVAETMEKLNDYMRRFEIKDATWRRRVADPNDKATAADYAAWRQQQIMVGRNWAALVRELSGDYHNSNVTARKLVEQMRSGVYAENMNFGTFEIERAAKIETSFSLYSRDAVEKILREQPELLPPPGKQMKAKLAAGKDIAWQEGQIQSVTLQSILQGESIPDMTKRIAREMGDANHKATIRYARTAATSAMNAGRQDAYHRAVELGVQMQREWRAVWDSRTRYSHRQLDGQVRDVDEPFDSPLGPIMYPGDPDADPANVYNCFPGETKAACDSEIVRSYKHKYSGELIKIKTSGGAEFACTPNHPILTPNGWISAKCLDNGDGILVTLGGNGFCTRRNPNIKHTFPSIEAIHNLWKFLFGFERVDRLGVNFHGDIPTSDVEIVSKKRFLRINNNPGRRNNVNKLFLKLSNFLVSCKSHFMSGFRGIYISALRFVRGGSKPLPFFRRSMSHSGVHGFGTPANVNTALPKYPINDLPTDTAIRSELLDGLSGNVFVDNVVSVKVSYFNGHVYNLQTKNGYYFVSNSISQKDELCNGIFAVVKNCRCRLSARVKGLEPQARKYRDPSIEGKTYEEWKNSHEERSNPLERPERIAEAMRRRTINELYRGK